MHTVQYMVRQFRRNVSVNKMQAIANYKSVAIKERCKVHTSCTSTELCLGKRACSDGLSGASKSSAPERYSIGEC